jgi:3-oxoacyl-[acyl-carrier protein] reductase
MPITVRICGARHARSSSGAPAWALAPHSGAHQQVSPFRAAAALPSVLIMNGKTVLVTGAGRGIGAAIAGAVATRGHHVIVNYRTDADAAEQVVAGLVGRGGSAQAMRADVTDPGQVDALVSRIVTEHGGVDAVVLNANTAPPPLAPLADIGWEAFSCKVLGELAGAFHLIARVLPEMRERGGGRIVFVGSTAADYVGGGRVAHGTAKAALATFARHVATESARDGIAVLTVAPGAVRTPAVEALLDEDLLGKLGADSVLGRMLEPADVGAAVALVLDPALRPATGSTVRLDGGWSVLVGGPSA